MRFSHPSGTTSSLLSPIMLYSSRDIGKSKQLPVSFEVMYVYVRGAQLYINTFGKHGQDIR